jgi:hypothetical protein
MAALDFHQPLTADTDFIGEDLLAKTTPDAMVP